MNLEINKSIFFVEVMTKHLRKYLEHGQTEAAANLVADLRLIAAQLEQEIREAN